MWELNTNNSTLEMLKNAKRWLCHYDKNDWKWQKMTKEMFENDANDLNTLKRSEKQSKWH